MSPSTTSDPLVGQLLDGRYRVGERIARGGMATVYEGVDLRLDRPVAIKVMPHHLADTEGFTPRFEREARAAARLSHPNVVGVYDQGADDSTVFLVMEYVPGGTTLRDLIRTDAPLPAIRSLEIVDEILVALTEAHEAHLIHRDIKPENVLITPTGQYKVADFGLARAVSTATTATATSGVLMGTVSYMAPELVTDGQAGTRTDVYAVGVVLYELLTGRKPYEGESAVQIAFKHVHADTPRPSEVVPEIPPAVDALVARATAREPGQRPADARDFLRLVRRVRHALVSGDPDLSQLEAELREGGQVEHGNQVEHEGWTEHTGQIEAGRGVNMIPGMWDATTTQPVPPPHPGPNYQPPVNPAGDSMSPNVRRAMVHDRRSRRRGLIALIVVVLLAATAALGGWYYGVVRYEKTPNVVGMSDSAARREITSAGLTFRIAGRAYSETVEQGAVMASDPAPGHRVLRHGTVAVTISRGPERHDVPSLAGMSVQQARDQLTSHHLTPAPLHYRFDDKVPSGQVLSTDPKAGTPLKRDASVILIVSKGPKPIAIKSFEGQNARQAKTTLEALGFNVTITHRSSETVDKGQVISQDPDRGIGHKGDSIALVVSSGPPLVQVPDVVRSGVDAAEQALRDAGFVPRVRRNTVDFGLGFVVRQDPGGGEKAPRGSVVTITVV
jgi:serine/threonine protein kinase/beta-lactam-binding protein with PASTA domain